MLLDGIQNPIRVEAWQQHKGGPDADRRNQMAEAARMHHRSGLRDHSVGGDAGLPEVGPGNNRLMVVDDPLWT